MTPSTPPLTPEEQKEFFKYYEKLSVRPQTTAELNKLVRWWYKNVKKHGTNRD